MYINSLITFIGLATGVPAFQPNEGPECKLTCRSRLGAEYCPPYHWVGAREKACSRTQYGCTDDNGRNCEELLQRPPLCVVNGPCMAGPAGCLEDKTGRHDGLPPGEYVGHCPKPQSQLQWCQNCRNSCAMRYPPGGAEFQECMRDRCLKECPSSLLDEIQYDDAKARCVQKGLLDGDADFQTCVTNSLNGTVEEEYRCRLQFFDTNTYCTGLNYTSGEYKYQDCITKSIGSSCSDENRCPYQIYRARKYCERDDDDDDDRLNLHKCISDQLAGLCSSDTLCEERYPDAQSYCAPENGDEYGNPEFQKCVAKLLDPFCRKDFACDKRKEDSEDYCRDHDHEDLKELDTKFDKCMKDCLGAICPEYSEAAQQHYKQYAMDL